MNTRTFVDQMNQHKQSISRRDHVTGFNELIKIGKEAEHLQREILNKAERAVRQGERAVNELFKEFEIDVKRLGNAVYEEGEAIVEEVEHDVEEAENAVEKVVNKVIDGIEDAAEEVGEFFDNLFS